MTMSDSPPSRQLQEKKVALEKVAPAVLAQGGTITFMAKGASMWPHIRDGDTVTVASVAGNTERPALGTVIVYFSPSGKLAMHRVTGSSGNKLKVRGDAYSGWAERVPLDRVLGRAVIVERNSRQKDLTNRFACLEGIVIARTGTPRIFLTNFLRNVITALRSPRVRRR